MIFIAAEYYTRDVWLCSNVFIVVKLYLNLYRKVSDLVMKQLRSSYGIYRALFEI
jgi:hypothetical protein